MVDLKKSSAVTDELQTEIRALTVTNQKLQSEIQTVRNNLNNELDVLTVRLDKIAYENEEIRREIYDINRTIDKLHYDLLDAIRNNRSDSRDWILTLSPIFMFGLLIFAVTIIKLLKS